MRRMSRVGLTKAGQRNHTRLDKQFSNLGNAADILGAVFGRKSQIVIDTGTDVITIQNTA